MYSYFLRYKHTYVNDHRNPESVGVNSSGFIILSGNKNKSTEKASRIGIKRLNY